MFFLLGIVNGIFAIYFIIRACMLNNVSYLVMGYGFFSFLMVLSHYF